MEILGGYTSALLLVGVAISMLVDSVERMVNPLPIGYDQAIATAVLGLAPAALLLAAMPSAQAADQTLLNATYDVGRELFSRIRNIPFGNFSHRIHRPDRRGRATGCLSSAR